jgi:hypothetical protein
MKALILNMIEDNSKMWKLTNSDSYKSELHKMNDLHRKKLSDIDKELKKYI